MPGPDATVTDDSSMLSMNDAKAVHLVQVQRNDWRLYMKGLLDVVLSVFLLSALAPLFILIAIAIKLCL